MDADDERFAGGRAPVFAGGSARRQRHAVTNQPRRQRARDAAGGLQAAIGTPNSPQHSTGLHWIRDQTDHRDSVRLVRASSLP